MKECLSRYNVGKPPKVTSQSRDVNKHGGGVIDLINMQMTYLICKVPNWYSYVLDWYANYLTGIHTALIDMQIT